MNLRQSVEFAALISSHAMHVVAAHESPCTRMLQQYWSHSRVRIHEWLRQLTTFEDELATGSHSTLNDCWPRIEFTLRDIFTSEILSRVWTATLVARDEFHGTENVAPIARRVFADNFQARRRAMQLMVNGPSVTMSQLAGIDRLRRKAERWTDVLLGYLVTRFDVSEFAFDQGRAKDFGDEVKSNDTPSGRAVWDLIMASVRLAFPSDWNEGDPHCDARSAVITSIVGSLPPSAFQQAGPLKSLAEMRIQHSSELPDQEFATEQAIIAKTLQSSRETLPQPQLSFVELRRQFPSPN